MSCHFPKVQSRTDPGSQETPNRLSSASGSLPPHLAETLPTLASAAEDSIKAGHFSSSVQSEQTRLKESVSFPNPKPCQDKGEDQKPKTKECLNTTLSLPKAQPNPRKDSQGKCHSTRGVSPGRAHVEAILGKKKPPKKYQ